MDILLAVTAFLLWLKVFLQFKITQIFGPYIKIMEQMNYDIVVYIGIFLLSIFFLACFGVVFFPTVYPNVFEAYLGLITLATTSYDITIFDEFNTTGYPLWFGRLY